MKPALAHHLVLSFSKPGDVILDPFSGSGTIPFEACLLGRTGLGMDISLLGTSISNAKLQLSNESVIKAILAQLDDWIKNKRPSDETIEKAKEISFNGPLAEYFHEDTFQEILAARNFFSLNRKPTAEWDLVLACMLHILHGNRPYALSRNSHPITPYAPTGDYIYKSLIEKLTVKVLKTLYTARTLEFIQGKCIQADVCKDWPSEFKNIDSIITSPPFFDSTRFYMTNWMRYWFCGWDRSSFDTETNDFVEVTQKRNISIYGKIFENFYEGLKKGGLVVLHLGYSKKCDMAKELSAIAKERFNILDLYTESVEHCESHGIRDKGTVTGHQYLIMRKP